MYISTIAFQVRILGSTQDSSCRLSNNQIVSFDKLDHSIPSPGIYTLYKRTDDSPIEIQAHFRACSLSELCACAVSVRVDDIIVVFDLCTKGYLQVWAWHFSGRVPREQDLPQGMELVSIDEGREYRVN